MGVLFARELIPGIGAAHKTIIYGRGLMVLTIRVHQAIGYPRKRSGTPRETVGAVVTQRGLLTPRSNCPFRATAAAAVVRSSLLAPTAAIGRLPFPVLSRGACTSVAAMPTWAATTGRTASLSAALKSQMLIPNIH